MRAIRKQNHIPSEATRLGNAAGKRRKDAVQGSALLTAVAEAMPHYPLDAEFIAALPDELLPFCTVWADGKG